MSIPSQTDQRYEVKFVAHETFYPQFFHWIRTHPLGFSEPHPIRRVNNVYFDTMTFQAYQANLLGGSARNKVRYRWYGDCLKLGPGQLEIKCKKNHLSWKKVFPITRPPLYSGTTWTGIKKLFFDELPPEGKLWLQQFPQPVLINHYTRRYLISKDQAVRVTFDYDQKCFDQRYKPNPNFSNRANLPHTFVLEIKCHKDHREFAKDLSATLPIRISRNSKYIQGIKASLSY